MMMKVVSFTGGVTEVYAGLRAIATGNASGEIPLAKEVIFTSFQIIFAPHGDLWEPFQIKKRIGMNNLEVTEKRS